ncbi:MAG: response regulator [Lentisphaerae bacterium]|nr:response regulator [Lentisphaerota bacterium]
MNRECSMILLLMAEDDPEDQMLVRKAFAQAHLANDLTVVNDGEELMDYLHRRPPYEQAIRPDLILLDLNMPRKDGREALREIKADPLLRSIPVVVLTTSSADEDILRSYDLGVNSYVQKPVTFPKLVELVTELGKYWFKIVKLPPHGE